MMLQNHVVLIITHVLKNEIYTTCTWNESETAARNDLLKLNDKNAFCFCSLNVKLLYHSHKNNRKLVTSATF